MDAPATVGNPALIVDRSKVQFETDYAAASSSLLRFDRRYAGASTSQGGEDSGIGARWRSNLDRRVTVNTSVSPAAAVRRGQIGAGVSFKKSGSNWVSTLPGNGTLRELTDAGGVTAGWIFTSVGGEVEEYDATGRLSRIWSQDGRVVTLSYQGSDLTAVSDMFGRTLSFAHFRDPVTGRRYRMSLTDPAGLVTEYLFDSATTSGPDGAPVKAFDLTSVQFPDGGTIRYLYGELDRFIVPQGSPIRWTYNVLTGIVDQSNTRLSSFTYDQYSDLQRTERAAAAYTYSLARSTTVTDAVLVTDPLGTVREYRFGTTSADNVRRLTMVREPCPSGGTTCVATIEYDTAGNPARVTDSRNFVSCSAYDTARRLETKRVEGLSASAVCSTSLSSPPAGDSVRTVSTQWHPDWRLETRRAEPKLLTTTTYNGQGASCAPVDALVDGKPIAVVCTRTEQATTDESGAAGFAATTTGPARTWTYTYNRFGQMLSSNGPRGDVTDTATYEYYPDTQPDWTMGDLKQITNAAGHITRFTKYNRHGQALQRIDPNGLVTNTTYDPRQRLTSVTAGSESTVYEYFPTGLLKKVTLPDAAFIAYTYDAAQRLTQVDDHRGNRIVYTLDAMGNRVSEQAKDPGGQLVRNLSRVIDALNRVQQMTGAL